LTHIQKYDQGILRQKKFSYILVLSISIECTISNNIPGS
jgi:hypothetical protein